MAEAGSGESGGIGPEVVEAGLKALFGRGRKASGDGPRGVLDGLPGEIPRVVLRDPAEDTGVLLKIHPPGSADAAFGDGRYEVVGEIGRGAVGIVFKGRDRDLGRDVALKVLRPDLAGNEPLVERFIEEAQIEGQLQHPGVVPIYGLGLQPDGRPTIAMKLVKGRSLSRLLKERREPSDDLRRFLSIFEKVCQAVGYAHGHGVVHRDLKPSNVLTGAFGEVQVVDWGFAKVLGTGRPEPPAPRERKPAGHTVIRTVRSGSTGSTSVAGSVMGTPAYMAPEQALGLVDQLDARTDVFSLGAILCEVLTGKPPYVADEEEDLLVLAGSAKLDDARARLDACGADPALVALCGRCLEPLRQDRPENAEVLDLEMAAWMAAAEERIRQADVDAEMERARLDREGQRAVHARAGRRRTLAAAGALLAAILLGGGGMLWRDRVRADRAAAAEGEVARALDGAYRLKGEGKLEEALATAKAAAGRAAADEAPEAAWARADSLVAAIQEDRDRAAAEAARVAKDRAMVERLEVIRLDQSLYMSISWTNDKYGAAFREHGIDIESLDPPEAAARIRGSAVASDLVAALDDWIQVRLTRSKGPRLEVDRWLQVVREADPDEYGRKIREAGVARDLPRLREIALAAEPAALRAATVTLLADYLGSAVCGGGDLEAAVDLLRRARGPHVGDIWVHAILANLLVSMNDPAAYGQEILQELETVRALRGGPGWAYMLGWHLDRAGDPAGAKLAYEASIREARTPSRESTVSWRLGVLLPESLARTGSREEAIRLRRRMVAEDPDDASASESLGRLLWDTGDLDGADAALRDAVRRGQDSADLLELMGSVALQRGDPGEARRAYGEALAAARAGRVLGPNTGLRIGKGLDSAGDFAGAVEAYRDALRIRPRCAEAWSGLSLALERAGDAAGAEEAGREALRIRPDSVSVRDALSMARGIAGDREGEIREAREAVRDHPESAEAHHRLAHGLGGDAGGLDGALLEMEEAVRLDPGNAEYRGCQASFLLAAGRDEEAVALLRAAAFLDRGTRPRIASGILRGGNIRRAHRLAGEEMKAGPSPATRFVLAKCLLLEGDLEGAAAASRQLETADPPGYLSTRLIILLRRGDSKGSLAVAEEAVRLYPRSGVELANLAAVKLEIGDLPGARAAEEKSLAGEFEAGYLGVREEVRRNLARLERIAALEPGLDAILAGSLDGLPAETLLDASVLCRARGRLRDSVRLFEAAAPRAGGGPEDFEHRCGFEAARTALRVAGDPAVPSTEAARLRGLALAWMSAHLDEGVRLAAGSRQRWNGTWKAVLDHCVDWRNHPDFAPVRDPASLGALPGEERKRWEDFAASVEARHRRLLGEDGR
jgi:serine/threonine-protein kinase